MRAKPVIRHVSLIVFIISILLSGCSLFGGQSVSDDEIAFISADGSAYETTFRDLGIGIVGNYNLKLHRADRSWVDFWVEGYRNGKKFDKPLLQFAVGRYPNETDEGRIGIAWIHGPDNKDMIKLYTKGSSTGLLEIDQYLGDDAEAGKTGWEYTMGKEGVSLKTGDTYLIGSFRKNKGSIRSGYDWSSSEGIEEMIESNDTVLLLKMKVREVEKKRY